jgi:predicted RNase H-like HicB family nuclease
MNRYVGLIRKDPRSDYGVSFPDLPGLVTAGVSLDEARVMAEEALAFHIEGLVKDGAPIPMPSDIDAIMSLSENRDGVPIWARFDSGGFNTSV